MIDLAAVQEALEKVRTRLLAQRNERGHWVGKLSSSALSTATALFTLYLLEKQCAGKFGAIIEKGLEWLARTQNDDGGWGDTPISLSNISTTTLVWCALAGHEEKHAAVIERAEGWLKQKAGSLEPERLAKAIRERYGKDKTFSVPILTMAALAGRLGASPECWKWVPQLPFELAAAPHKLYAALRLPVVSYALPALIAIGQVRHFHRPSRNPALRILRNKLVPRTLKILREIQPLSGGYLEAAPLTSFVCMSLISAGEADHSVVQLGVQFLLNSFREDGSCPIDTDLATWVTTLSINALYTDPHFRLSAQEREAAYEWLLEQQGKVEDPYTHAAPGAWAWTDKPGGVPDADDTPGALIALKHLAAEDDAQAREAASRGVQWLMNLQNRDGGIPTFCRGWTNLPFDRSGADLTAHALLAWDSWPTGKPKQYQRATGKALRYLLRTRRQDKAWLPLWFGNQHCPDDINPIYGTSRVLLGLVPHVCELTQLHDHLSPSLAFLLGAQKQDGGWGGASGAPSSIEETALATQALAAHYLQIHSREIHARIIAALPKAFMYLRERIGRNDLVPSPIGFYFAKLWYYEELYPLIFTVGALSQLKRALTERPMVRSAQ